MEKRTKELVWAGLFTALVTITTMAIHVPSVLGGYVNAGDAVVVLSAFLLGPAWGALAAGLGSALADIFASYLVYAPGTLVIKALMALTAGAILRSAKKKNHLPMAIFGALLAEVIMIVGYFCYDAFILGYGLAATANIPGNCIQGAFGILAGTALFYTLIKIPYVRNNF